MLLSPHPIKPYILNYIKQKHPQEWLWNYLFSGSNIRGRSVGLWFYSAIKVTSTKRRPQVKSILPFKSWQEVVDLDKKKHKKVKQLDVEIHKNFITVATLSLASHSANCEHWSLRCKSHCFRFLSAEAPYFWPNYCINQEIRKLHQAILTFSRTPYSSVLPILS